jgi:hypothetical protein
MLASTREAWHSRNPVIAENLGTGGSYEIRAALIVEALAIKHP